MSSVKSKLDEVTSLLKQIEEKENTTAVKGGPYGNDFVDLYNRLKELLASIGVEDLVSEGLHAAIHFAIAQLTSISQTLPLTQKIVVGFIVKVLEMVDKRWHPEPTPA